MKRPAWRDEPPPDPDNPSKSQIKRDFHELQEFALKLLTIPHARFEALEMDERLRDAVHELRMLKSLPARARQAQYIGKLLREVDLEPFRTAMLSARLPQTRRSR